MKKTLVLSALALSLAACSSKPTASPENATNEASVVSNASDAPVNQNDGNVTAAPKTPANVLTLEGLGDLRIGEAVPAGSTWAERGAQASETCRTVTSPAHDGVYAIVEDSKVRRITVGKRSEVKLIEGIGVGATEKQVLDAFPGFRSEPHKYVEAPAKYLTAPNAARGDPALRFEIDKDGKVSLMHVGTMPVLGYVEGCA